MGCEYAVGIGLQPEQEIPYKQLPLVLPRSEIPGTATTEAPRYLPLLSLQIAATVTLFPCLEIEASTLIFAKPSGGAIQQGAAACGAPGGDSTLDFIVLAILSSAK
jgi:hypothetical protein